MKYPYLLLVLLGGLLTSCSSGRDQLVFSQVPNYQPGSAQQLLFLNFTITQPAGVTSAEQVTLTNAIAGQGTMKNLSTPVHNQNYLRVLYHYDDQRAPREETYEHPLYRSVEVPSEDGTLSRRELSSSEGMLNLRLAYDSHLVRLELFSHTPERGTRKIHTLRIKP
ncbi:hypothetical protein GCM10027275_48980 [Rhabdobacter roseus]|uniref:Lipoprotein n=1 Tax=Rhabdobacter roseus TaxID=1655419 RepID=A0A840TZB6_9BACT|nr:hypothetical protein [Rhabdobacter roseus]MBB5286962.1 hypothetical protein [Rhabdobacter roseus]